MVVLATPDQAERLRDYGRVLTLPCSFAALVQACVPEPSVLPHRSMPRGFDETAPQMA
jgi:hypothetical protein